MLKGEVPEERGIGWMYNKEEKSVHNGYAFRYGGCAAAVWGAAVWGARVWGAAVWGCAVWVCAGACGSVGGCGARPVRSLQPECSECVQ
jgi:hypothetical protein